MIVRRIVIGLLVAGIALWTAGDRWAGMLMEPVLEKKLTRLFGMPVHLDGLRIRVWSGEVDAEGVEFLNQDGFSPVPHLKADGLSVKIHFPSLLQKKVRIDTVLFTRPVYLIERQMRDGRKQTNVTAWVRHIRAQRKKGSAPTPWSVEIQRIQIQGGSFIFDDQSRGEERRRFVFTRLEGFLTDFRWRSEDPERLEQRVAMTGRFGEKEPAPFWIMGASNFATGEVSFDLTGEVKDGSLLDYPYAVSGLPIDIRGGRFSLTSRTRCVRRDLDSENVLVLKGLEVAPGKKAADKIWGIPVTAAAAFLQDQKTLPLNVVVSGNIQDPKFDFPQAFQQAFQASIGLHVKKGMSFLADGTAGLAMQTVSLVGGAPQKVAEGFEKITGSMNSKT